MWWCIVPGMTRRVVYAAVALLLVVCLVAFCSVSGTDPVHPGWP